MPRYQTTLSFEVSRRVEMIAEIEGRSVSQTLRRLVEAGLDISDGAAPTKSHSSVSGSRTAVEDAMSLDDVMRMLED